MEYVITTNDEVGVVTDIGVVELKNVRIKCTLVVKDSVVADMEVVDGVVSDKNITVDGIVANEAVGTVI